MAEATRGQGAKVALACTLYNESRLSNENKSKESGVVVSPRRHRMTNKSGHNGVLSNEVRDCAASTTFFNACCRPKLGTTEQNKGAQKRVVTDLP